MSIYSITWSYRKKVTTETVEATSRRAAAAQLVRNVVQRSSARRQSVEILKVEEVAAGNDRQARILADQKALRELAASRRKPPKRVTR